MVSDASKKKAAQKKIAAAAKRGGKAAAAAVASKVAAVDAHKAAVKVANEIADLRISDRTCTGVLCSHPLSRDIRIESLSVTFHGHDLIVDSELELNYGRRYGLLGLNGCGKSTLLTAIGCRELPIPEHMDIYHLSREIEATDMSALEAVINCDEERLKLEKEAEALAAQDDGGGETLERIYERLEALDAATAEKRAAEILHGLGFNKEMQAKKTRDFSGGWRMRIALARALFMNPTILLLDEPTNHLDLEACVWLEESLKKFDRILVVISHSQDFLNGVCTNIIHMQNKKLKLYTGNYDQYVQTRSELEENQMKQYKWEQEQIASMKEYIARFGHGSAKLARQAQSKEKTLAKMERGGLTERVVKDKVLVFHFTDVGKLPPPVLQFVEVTFGYTPDNLIYKNIDFGVDCDSRVALVGPNGAGKQSEMATVTTQASATVLRPCPSSKARFLSGSSGRLNREVSFRPLRSPSFKVEAKKGEWLPGLASPAYLNGSLPGDNGFDPLGLAEDPENLKWFVQAELVNGRWAMLGVAGMLLPEVFTSIGIINVPKWYDAGKEEYFASSSTLFVIEFILFHYVEIRRWQDIKNPGSVNQDPIFKQYSLPPNEVGYPGGIFNPLNFAPTLEAKEKELANGRLAMLAFLGFIVQHNVTGKGPFDNLLQHISDPWHNTIVQTLSSN